MPKGGKGGGRGGGGAGLHYQPYVPKFLREMGGGAAPDGSIAGRKKALDAKSAALEGDDIESEEEQDYDKFQAKIAAEGGCIMTQEDFSKGKMKKTKRSRETEGELEGRDGKEGGEGDGPGKAKEEQEEEMPELDKEGRPIIKFKKVDVTQLGDRRKIKKSDKKGGAAAIKNKTLLSFEDDE